MNEFSHWTNFYVVIGAAAGSLIGLQFVVMTLIAQGPKQPTAEVGQAFSTPTVLHFCTVILIAALAEAPWQTVVSPSICYGLIGIMGIGYSTLVPGRMRAQDAYDPEFADWMSYVVLPLAAYVVLLAGGLAAALWDARIGLFGIAAAGLLLLFIAIYNAWDTVTYQVFRQPGDEQPEPEDDQPNAN